MSPERKLEILRMMREHVTMADQRRPYMGIPLALAREAGQLLGELLEPIAATKTVGPICIDVSFSPEQLVELKARISKVVELTAERLVPTDAQCDAIAERLVPHASQNKEWYRETIRRAFGGST